jgi:hypothetical protein
VVVARPTRWGNPYRGATPAARAEAVERFTAELLDCMTDPWGAAYPIQIRVIAERIGELAGRDLACWCPLDQPCHADALLAAANQPAPTGPIA